MESEHEMKLACTSGITNMQAHTKGETMVQHGSIPVKDQIENLKKIRATKAIRYIHGLIARNEKHNYETTWSDGDDLNSITEDSYPDIRFHANNLPFRKKDFPEKWDLSGHFNNDKPFRVKRISKRLCLWGKKIESLLEEIEKIEEQQRPDDSSIVIDDQFSVSYHNRKCSLGNTQTFKLMKLLVDEKDKYVGYTDILAQCIEDIPLEEAKDVEFLDESERDKVIQLKAQLCKKLKCSELQELASAIESTKGYYRLNSELIEATTLQQATS